MSMDQPDAETTRRILAQCLGGEPHTVTPLVDVHWEFDSMGAWIGWATGTSTGTALVPPEILAEHGLVVTP